MGNTISTHNGSRVAREHNIRNEKVCNKEAHIDLTRTHEVWKDEEPRKAYQRLFGNAVDEYNRKQERPERRIRSYYNDICEDAKKHPVYEMIIGIYGKDEAGKSICAEEQGKEIMRTFVDDWQNRNPALQLIGAYYHADEEGEPHVHIDYIPVAHGYTKGLSVQSGLVKALGEMGFEKTGSKTAQMKWEARENKYLETLCNSRGLTIDHPKGEKRKHIETEQYKAQKTLESAITKTTEMLNIETVLNEKIESLSKQRDEANKQTQRALQRQAKAVKLHKNKEASGYTYDKTLVEDIKKIALDVKKDAEAVAKTDLDIQARLSQAEELQRKAEEERKQIARYKALEESYINQRATEQATHRFEAFVKEFFSSNPTKRVTRLEKLCQTIEIDGKTVLDIFEQKEKTLKAKLEQGWKENR